MNDSNFYQDHWAVVIGAAGKTGVMLTHALAGKNVNLILMDEDKSLLHMKANALHVQYHIRVEALLQDNCDSTLLNAIKRQDVGLFLSREYVDNMDATLSNLINMHAVDIRILPGDAMESFVEKSCAGEALEELNSMKAA